MKKYLISTLTAAAAMAVPAFASGTGTSQDPYTDTCNDLDLSGFEANTTVYINGITSGYWANKNMTVVADINIGSGGMSLTNAYSDNIYTFAGAITGNGDWTFTGTASSTQTQHYIFTGSLAGYSGNFSMTASNSSGSEGYLQFGDGGQAATNTNVSGTGSITEATNGSGFAVIYNYGSLASGSETAITIGNTSITTQDLRFTGSVSYDVSSALAGAGSNATLAISTSGTVTVSGSVSGFKSITVESGSTLAVGSTGSLDLSGATVDLASAIQNSGTVTLDTSTVFVLDNLTATSGSLSEGSATYTLISGGTINGYDGLGTSNVSSEFVITEATFTVDSGSLMVTVTTNGLADGLHGSGTIESPYFTTGSNSYKFSFSTGNFTAAGTTVYLATETQSFGSTAVDFYWSDSFTANCDIVIGTAGICMTDGGSGQYYNFTGKISGDGGLTVTNVNNSSSTGSGVAQHYGFTGDLSGWNGDITITTSNSYDYLIFGGTITGADSKTGDITGISATQAATNSNVSGKGAIYVDYGSVEYVYTAGANGQTGETLTVTNSSIEAHTIIFTGGVNYDVSSNLTGWDGSSSSGASTTTGSTLTISTTGTVTVSGKVSDFDHIVVSDGSGLTVASGASVTLKEGSTLSVADGGTLTLNTSIAADGATVSFSENASLVLTDAFLASTINTLDADGTITIITASAIYYNETELSDLSDLDGFASIVSTSDNYELSNWTYEGGVLSADVTYLPEPELFSIFFGLGAIGLVATRRRRRKVA